MDRREQILEALAVFLDPNQVTNLRAWGEGKAVTGHLLFRDHAALARQALELEGRSTGVYFTPNPLRDDLLPADRVWAKARPGEAAAENVARRTWLLIDVDPVRQSEDKDASTTDDERAAGWDVHSQARDLCDSAGLQGAVVGDSGNGWHLCYPIDLPNDDASYALVADFLAGLEVRCGSEAAHIDQKPKDASRVWKLYGTLAKKGPPGADRPHRYSRLVEGAAPAPGLREANALALAGLVDVWRAYDRKRQAQAQAQPRAGSRPDAVTRARAWLAKKENVSVQGSFGSNPCYNVACVLAHGFALTDDEALAAIADWNASCRPPWSEKELLHKFADARKDPNHRFPRGHLLGQERPGPSANGHAHGPAGGPAVPADDAPLVVAASTIEPRAVRWLWPGRIPLAKMTAFAGVGGLGKTFALCDITARVTTGQSWPDLQPGPEPGNVLFISGEDDADDTLVPRLIEMGADLSRVFFLAEPVQGEFTLKNTALLERLIDGCGGVRMVVIDPPTAYLAGVDDNKNSELRQLLAPLKLLCQRREFALVFNTHVNKGSGQKVEAMMRVMGSVAWVNTVRSAVLFAKDPDDPTGERRLFVGMKSNIARERKGLAYRIVTTTGELARLEWLGEVDTTADQAVNREPGKRRRDQVAADWLVERFREKREWASDDLFKAAKEHGVSRNAVFEAKNLTTMAGIVVHPHTGADGKKWYTWRIPDDWPALATPATDPCPREGGYSTF